MMDLLTPWTVVQSDLLASGQNQALAWGSNYGTILLDVLAIVFLLFGLFIFLSFWRKETLTRDNGGFRRPKNAGFQRSRSRAGLLSLFVLALPLIALFFTGSDILAQTSSFKPTPTIVTRPPTSKPLVNPPNNLLSPGFLTVGVYTIYPPQDSTANGQPAGFDIEFAKALAKEMGLQVKFVPDKFDNLLSDLQSQHVDVVIAGMPITSDQQSPSFIPYLKSVETLMVPKANPHQVKHLTDLCGLKVGIIDGTPALADLQDASAKCTANRSNQQPINIDHSQTDAAKIVQALQQGSIDVAYLDVPIANYYMNMKQYQGHFITGDTVPEKANQGIAVRQGDSSMEQAVGLALRAMQLDKTYQKLLKSNGWDFSSESL